MSDTTITTTRQGKVSALALMAERCAVDPDKLHATLKNTVFKGATDDEMLALVVTANVYELNPILKELYAFPKKGGGITPMVGIDGWLKIANRQPNFNGMEVDVYGDEKGPTHATCTIYVKGREHPTKITEYFDECRRNTEPWNQMPRRMLRNKAIIQAVRVAFGISGIQDEDEAADSFEPRNVTPGKTALDENPYADASPQPTPAATAKPKAARAKAEQSPVAVVDAEPTGEEDPEPSREALLAELTAACKEYGVKGSDAQAAWKQAGLLGEAESVKEMFDADLVQNHAAMIELLKGGAQ